jgi:hypothetical protein
MRMGHFGKAFFGLAIILAGAAGALGQVSGTATMTAVADGKGGYDYTVDLTNTGTENIETFWFGWQPGYDFLTSNPTVTKTPTNWTTYVESGYYGGNSIEFYDTSSSSPLAPGKSSAAFQFDSPDSPAVLSGLDPIFHYYPATYSYLYSGTAQASDAGIINSIPITTAVPEPTSFVMLGLSAVAWMGRRRPNAR